MVRLCVKLLDFFRGWILILLTWNLSHFVPNPVEIFTRNFRKKLFGENFSEILSSTKGTSTTNLWNFALLSEILFWVSIALKIFTQVLSYVVCIQVRRHVHKQITKRRYKREKPGRFVFEKPVLLTLGLGLSTPYSLGILVWNFYKTFVTISNEFWLRFEPQIRPTRLAINFLFILAKAEKEGSFVCETVWFFSWVNAHSFYLKFVAFCPKFSGDSYVEFQDKTISGEFFRNFVLYQGYPLPKLVKFRFTFWNFILGPYCAENIHTSTFICCLHPGKEAQP